jgi:hypothetical protein
MDKVHTMSSNTITSKDGTMAAKSLATSGAMGQS